MTTIRIRCHSVLQGVIRCDRVLPFRGPYLGEQSAETIGSSWSGRLLSLAMTVNEILSKWGTVCVRVQVCVVFVCVCAKHTRSYPRMNTHTKHIHLTNWTRPAELR